MLEAFFLLKGALCEYITETFPVMTMDINFIERVKAQHDGPPDPSLFIYTGPTQTMACYGHCKPKSTGRTDLASNGPDHVSMGSTHVFYNKEANRNYGVRVLNPPVNVNQLARFGLRGNRRVIRRRNRTRRRNERKKLVNRHGHEESRVNGPSEENRRGLDNKPEEGLMSDNKNDKYLDESSHNGKAEYEIHNYKFARDVDSSTENAHMAYGKRDLHAMSRGHHLNTRRVIAYGKDDERKSERVTEMRNGRRPLGSYIGNIGEGEELWPDDWHWDYHVDKFVSPED